MNEEEKKIIKQLNNYKLLLSSKLLEEINKENLKEAKLMEYYNNSDEKYKQKLLEEINIKKAESAQRIIDLNEKMSKQYKEYEKKLRNQI